MSLSVPSPRATPQKTSNSLDDLHFDDWSSLLPCNKFLTFDTRFDSGKRHVGLDVHNGFDSHNGYDSHMQTYGLRLDNLHGCRQPSG